MGDYDGGCRSVWQQNPVLRTARLMEPLVMQHDGGGCGDGSKHWCRVDSAALNTMVSHTAGRLVYSRSAQTLPVAFIRYAERGDPFRCRP